MLNILCTPLCYSRKFVNSSVPVHRSSRWVLTLNERFHNASGQRTEIHLIMNRCRYVFDTAETNRIIFRGKQESLWPNVNLYCVSAWVGREWKHFPDDYLLNVYRESSNFISFQRNFRHIFDLFGFNFILKEQKKLWYLLSRSMCWAWARG